MFVRATNVGRRNRFFDRIKTCRASSNTTNSKKGVDLSFAKTAPTNVRKVACLGTGVIGGGWVCDFLRNGLEVTAYDPSPGAEENMLRMVDKTWPILEKLGLKDGASPNNLKIFTDPPGWTGKSNALAEALDGVDCVQESVPENLEVKRKCFKIVDELLPSNVPVLSSISGSYFLADLQSACESNPERFTVAHPFNPPYLIPLVEIVGSEITNPSVIEWAFQFYSSIGKFPLACSQENPGYVGNRLQDVLTALHMLVSGEATFEEIDAAIVYV
eukprot:GSMAST32.ASY1.ANO1.758.1 assembled CDS